MGNRPFGLVILYAITITICLYTLWFVACSIYSYSPVMIVSGAEYSVVKTFNVGDRISVYNPDTYLTECDQYWGKVTISRSLAFGGVMPFTYRITSTLVIRIDDVDWHYINYGENWIKMGHN